MYRFLLIFFFSVLCASSLVAQTQPTPAYDAAQAMPYEREQSYAAPNDASLPDWVREMYAPDPNLLKVEALYKAYYQKNVFVKNEHTQYFKRWTKVYRKFTQKDGTVRPPAKATFDKDWATLATLRLTQKNAQQQRTATAWGAANWVGIGPFGFDKDAAGHSHAPGAAHVYTVEKAPSNPMSCIAAPRMQGSGKQWTEA